MKLKELKDKISRLGEGNKLLYTLSYNHTHISFENVEKIVSTEEAINLIDDAENNIKPSINISGNDCYRDYERYYSVSYMQKTSYGANGVFCIDFFIIKEKEILDGIEKLKEPYRSIAIEEYNTSKIGKYESYGDIELFIYNQIKTIVDNIISDNGYEIEHHVMNMIELRDLLVEEITNSVFPIDDFTFYVDDDKMVLNIKHFLFETPLEIEQWIETIRHVEYNF